jgi:flagellar motor switch protein FliG
LTIALKHVNEEAKEKIFRNISKRTSLAIKEEMESMNYISDKDVITSRKKIIETIKQLSGTGEIVIAGM